MCFTEVDRSIGDYSPPDIHQTDPQKPTQNVDDGPEIALSPEKEPVDLLKELNNLNSLDRLDDNEV